MCWAIKNATSNILPDNDLLTSFAGQNVGSGRQTVCIRRDHDALVATPTRFGMIPPNAMGRRDMFWNARIEKINKITIWTRLHRQRCVVPISAYCENRPAETWLSGAPAYLICFYDTHERDGGIVAITESDGTENGRRPVVTDEAGALAWLEANHWDVTKVAQEVARVQYDELDLFESMRLSTDLRTTYRSPRQAA